MPSLISSTCLVTLPLALLFGCSPLAQATPDSPPQVSLPIPPPALPSTAIAPPIPPVALGCVPAANDDEEAPRDCAPLELGAVERVERSLRQSLEVTPPSRLVIDYGCDGATGALDHVDLEEGSGHGGDLRLVRFEVDGDRILLRSIELPPYSVHRSVALKHAEVPRASLEPAARMARVALVARPHRVALRVGPMPKTLTLSAWGTSNDFHRLLDIVDEDGGATGGKFTGYENSASEHRYVPILLATDPLVSLIETLTWTDVAPTDADRAWFTERLIATMAASPGSWVAERYLTLAAPYGDDEALPVLRKIASSTGGGADDASLPRQRAAAKAAIEAIERRAAH